MCPCKVRKNISAVSNATQLLFCCKYLTKQRWFVLIKQDRRWAAELFSLHLKLIFNQGIHLFCVNKGEAFLSPSLSSNRSLDKAVECSLEGLEPFWLSLLLNAQHRGEKTTNTASYQLGYNYRYGGNFPIVQAFVYKIGLLWLVETQELFVTAYYTQINAVCSTEYIHHVLLFI